MGDTSIDTNALLALEKALADAQIAAVAGEVRPEVTPRQNHLHYQESKRIGHFLRCSYKHI